MYESMNDNFSKLEERIFDCISKSDLIKIKNILSSIEGSTLISGVGGSHVVSNFLSKVLNSKNNIECENITPRDLIYKNINCYKNIIVCSYGGRNYGVDISFNNNLNKYLLSSGKRENVANITYKITELEHSFISLSATLIPMTIILLYYCNDVNVVKEILSSSKDFKINNNKIYEILTGYETSTASSFIESTLTESGIALPIIHDKYDYCHGRSTLNYNFNNNIIFFDCNKELDKIYREQLNKYYKNVITISKKYDDEIINDYYFTYISMLLCKKIAEYYNKDLCKIEYSPIVKKLYYFKGDM